MANDSYWSDGKAEFDIYDGQLMRAGEPRHCEVLHILTRERIDPKTLARVTDPKRRDAINAVRLQQIWNAPIGVFVEQASLTALWRLDSLSLAQLNLAGTNSFGNLTRQLEEKREGETSTWLFSTETNRTGTSISPPSVRGLRGRASAPGTNDRLYETASGIRDPACPFDHDKRSASIVRPCEVSWKPADKSIEVVVQQGANTSRFLIDRDFPFLLREWSMPDGSKLKMKRGLKADYWNYGRNGDRERALKNPMLQHPD